MTLIGDDRTWDGSFEDNIRCPYCNDVDYEVTDYPSVLQFDGNHTEAECSVCGKAFTVTLSVEYTYATKPSPSSEP